MKVRNNLEHSKKNWNKMSKKDKINFYIILSTYLFLFLSIIAGGIVLYTTTNPWLLITSIACFVGFGLCFIIIKKIIKSFYINLITKSNNTIQAVAVIENIVISWHSYTGSKVKSLTLDVNCNINGIKSKCWYQFNQEELMFLKTEAVLESTNVCYTDRRELYYRYEVDPESIDKFFKLYDKILFKYFVNKPKYCIFLSKVK